MKKKLVKGSFALGKAVYPIFGFTSTNSPGVFLGTGFFVSTPYLLFVTCDHVLREEYSTFGIAIPGQETKIATIVKRNASSDLAILLIDRFVPNWFFVGQLADFERHNMVSCFEYGTSVAKGRMTELNPATRIGNITRFLDLTNIYGVAGDEMLELSFPALRGASGAPVFSNKSPFEVLGVIKANYSSELLPSQVEEIYDEKGKLEERVQFMLPQAVAIHVKHLHEIIRQVIEESPVRVVIDDESI